MEKRKIDVVSVIIIFVVVIVASVFLGMLIYYFFTNSKYNQIILENPIVNLSDEEAIAFFNENYIRYLLYSIDADELRAVPLTSNNPKIEVHVNEDIFNAEVQHGSVLISHGEITGKDIVIRTNKEEVVKMLRDKKYITESFNSGLSQVELIASEKTLFAKGYLKLYDKIKGTS